MIDLTVPFLSACILVSGAAYLYAVARGQRRWRYLLKPGTMLLIMALALSGWTPGSAYDRFIVAGLAVSVVGDIFLMLPDRFMHGLGAFLAAHLCYIAAFGWGTAFGLNDALVLGALAAAAVPLFRRLRRGVLETGGSLMLTAVGLYVAVIAVMVWRAVAYGSPIAVAGAFLFFLSDALLGWNRFVQPYRWAGHGVMTTYYAAQYCLALSLSIS